MSASGAKPQRKLGSLRSPLRFGIWPTFRSRSSGPYFACTQQELPATLDCSYSSRCRSCSAALSCMAPTNRAMRTKLAATFHAEENTTLCRASVSVPCGQKGSQRARTGLRKRCGDLHVPPYAIDHVRDLRSRCNVAHPLLRGPILPDAGMTCSRSLCCCSGSCSKVRDGRIRNGSNQAGLRKNIVMTARNTRDTDTNWPSRSVVVYAVIQRAVKRAGPRNAVVPCFARSPPLSSPLLSICEWGEPNKRVRDGIIPLFACCCSFLNVDTLVVLCILSYLLFVCHWDGFQ